MATLYELTDQYMQLQAWMEDGEISEQAFLDTLELIDDEIEDKLEGYVHVIKNIEMQMEAAKKESERLAKFKSTREGKVKALKERILAAMQTVNKKKIPAGLFTVRYQNSPETLKITDESTVPPGYFIPQPPKVDRATLLSDLKSGTIQPTETIFTTQGQHIRIS